MMGGANNCKLTEVERYHIAFLVWYSINSKRWTQRQKYTKAKIAKLYGVTPKTVRNCYARYFPVGFGEWCRIRELTLEDGKKVAAGIKLGLPDAEVAHVTATVEIREADGSWLIMLVEGAPPFLTFDMVTSQGDRETYLGHPEMQ